MNPTKINQIFEVFKASNPDPKTELRFRNHFELLIAVILSAQATDISVNKITPTLFQVAPTPEKMIALGKEGIKEQIRTIGLFNSKARNIYKACQTLVTKYGGKIPQTRKALEELAGVGTKTAGVVLNVSMRAETIPVDTHVFRVSNRMNLVQTKTAKSTESALSKIIPKWALGRAHHWIILHGRYICKARKPMCQTCPILQFCEYDSKTV